MALTSALYTGLSGLDVNQTQLNVVGNNIANANTTAFKSSRALFRPQFYVTNGAGTPADGNSGGTNPSQLGLGAQVASIQRDFTTGSIQTTGKDTDMALEGSGFFAVRTSDGLQYTRDGSFSLNQNDQLTTSAGAYVQGFGVDASGKVIQGATQAITIPLGKKAVAKTSTQATLTGNLNAGGTVAAGASILDGGQTFTDATLGTPAAASKLTDLRDSTTAAPIYNVGDVLTLNGTRGGATVKAATLTVTATTTVQDLQNFTNETLGIDPSFTSDTPAPGAQLAVTGTAATFKIVGNLGEGNALTAKLTNGTGSSPFSFSDDPASNPTGTSLNTSMTAYDSLGNAVDVSVTAVLTGKSDAGTSWRFYATSPDSSSGQTVGSGTLNFNTTGQLASTTGTTLSIARENTGSGSPLSLKLDFGSVTALHSDATQDDLHGKVDGNAAGKLTTFSVGTDGTITGEYDNGQSETLGQVAVASFENPEGLIDKGGNMFISGPSSGNATVGVAEADGNGTLRSGSLESSNVDISKEFVNLIVSSTGFSASSKIISTSQQLLTDLLNSQR